MTFPLYRWAFVLIRSCSLLFIVPRTVLPLQSPLSVVVLSLFVLRRSQILACSKEVGESLETIDERMWLVLYPANLLSIVLVCSIFCSASFQFVLRRSRSSRFCCDVCYRSLYVSITWRTSFFFIAVPSLVAKSLLSSCFGFSICFPTKLAEPSGIFRNYSLQKSLRKNRGNSSLFAKKIVAMGHGLDED